MCKSVLRETWLKYNHLEIKEKNAGLFLYFKLTRLLC